MIYASYNKLSKELKNSIKIKVVIDPKTTF